jgi:predicted methyltransferase
MDGVCNPTILRNLAEVKPGQSIAVIQLEPLSTPHSIGYYPHAFSELVGRRGHVYVITTSVTSDMGGGGSIKGRAVTGDYGDANVSKVMAPMPLTSFPVLPKLDVVWAAQGVYSYFDLLRPFEHESLKPPFQSAMFKPVFGALRPGGLFLLMGEDSEVICFQNHPDCGARHARQINGVPYRGMLELIEQAGFGLEMGLTALRDPMVRPQHSIWPGHIELGPKPTSFPIGYPFLWKLRRLDSKP